MIPCPEVALSHCGTELQRVTPSEHDPREMRGLSALQLGVARHLVVIHSYTAAAAGDVARSWAE